MLTKITFRHFKGNHPDLHDTALEVAEGFTKYHDSIISTNVEFINEHQKTVEFTVHLQGSTLVAKESSEDFQKSLHEAGEKIVRQIKKYKTKNLSTRTQKLDAE